MHWDNYTTAFPFSPLSLSSSKNYCLCKICEISVLKLSLSLSSNVFTTLFNFRNSLFVCMSAVNFWFIFTFTVYVCNINIDTFAFIVTFTFQGFASKLACESSIGGTSCIADRQPSDSLQLITSQDTGYTSGKFANMKNIKTNFTVTIHHLKGGCTLQNYFKKIVYQFDLARYK